MRRWERSEQEEEERGQIRSAEGRVRTIGAVRTMSMSKCSSTVFIVRGRVGFVEEGMTLGREHTVIMSGAWPPVKGVSVGVAMSVDLVSCGR
jgi:hypothetical protein